MIHLAVILFPASGLFELHFRNVDKKPADATPHLLGAGELAPAVVRMIHEGAVPVLTPLSGTAAVRRLLKYPRLLQPHLRLYSIEPRKLNQSMKSNGLADHRELYSGLIRLHVLHHAANQPIFGLGMIEELGRHGYKVSPGMFYPLLHSMEKKGLLRSRQRGSRNDRRVYRATPEGRKALAVAKRRVYELFSELFENDRDGKLGKNSRRDSLR